MIQLQNLHLCIFSAKWEEKKERSKQKRSDARRHKRQQRRATSQGGWAGEVESVEGRKDNACHLIIRT
jgi:hypothetical protein